MRLLEKVGLGRPEVRAWAMYDVANSAFFTTIIGSVFPIYFASVAAADLDGPTATARFATATTIALAISAILSPFLGALADFRAAKKRFLAGFLFLGVLATAAMWFIHRGDWMLAAVLFILGNIGASASFVFYDALLPHVARPDEVDRVSTAGYALGYLGGGVLLAINLAWIQMPRTFGLADAGQATRLSFLSVAVWWLLFSIPLLRRVPEPARRLAPGERGDERPLRASFARLRTTLRELRQYKQAFLLLVAFLIYNDGIGTIIRMAPIYGAEIGIGKGALITAVLLVQFVGIPCAFAFGWLASKIGPKRAVMLSLAVYALISVVGYFMKTATHFFGLAILVGMVQGGSQALSRSLFASMVPTHKSSEFFAFFAVFEKFAGILGPLLFAGTIAATGSSRNAILAVIAFFAIGAVLLSLVDVEAGRKVAREAEARIATS